VIRVFIVAASSLARAGLQSMVAARTVEVGGSVANLEALVAQWADVDADVILIEASGRQFESAIDSLAATEIASDAAIAILTDHAEPALFARALRAGVRAILPSDIAAEQLIAALEAVAAGLVVMHPAEIGAALPAAEPAARPLAELAEPLTPRESEVLQMLASGLANKEIAARLAISDHTAKFHVASILGKLGAGSRTEAVAIGIRRGLVLL
jgi:two-component system, NarL family, response regulator YdfI